jgi:hypothetical protein
MTYMEQFTQGQLKQAYEELRPDFREKLFVGGEEQAKELAQSMAGLIYPGTDCFAEHYRTCYEFYLTYALARLMGCDKERAVVGCKNKYGTLPPVIFAAAVELCQACLNQSFPTLE